LRFENGHLQESFLPVSSDPIAAARALLPWWVPWGNLGAAVAAAALIAGISTWVTAAIATRPLRSAEKRGALDEDERARLGYPFRRAIWRHEVAALLFIPAATALLGDDLAYLPRSVVVVAAAVVTLVVSGWVARRFAPAEMRARATPARRRRALAFVAIWFCRLPLVLALLWLLGPELDAMRVILAALVAALYVSLWFGSVTWLMRVTRLAKPGSARLVAAARVAAERCAIRLPTLLEIDLPIANLFAFPTSHAIVATSGAVALLDDAELAAICTHEASHLSEGRRMVVGRHAGDAALLFLSTNRLLLDRFGLVPLLALDCAATFVALVVVKLVASHGERRADAIAHGAEPELEGYLRALEKLHRANGLPLALATQATARRGLLSRIFGRGGAHGSFADRAAALGETAPAGAAPPSRLRPLMARLAGAAVGTLGVLAVAMLAFVSFVGSRDPDSRLLEVSLALGNDVELDLHRLASQWIVAGRIDDGATLLAARAELEPDSPDAMADLATVLADTGRSEPARAALTKAIELFRAQDSPLRPVHHSGLFVVGVIESDDAHERREKRLRALADRLGADPP
jgi:Zn-dependent protease with chaperone function